MALSFLTAHWRHLLVANFCVRPEILRPFLPYGTELDDFEGLTFVSLVGFYFQNNRFLGVVPTFPSVSFEEINLRFYVKRRVNGEIRRAVSFIKEIVPSKMIATMARQFYNEPYEKFQTFRDDEQFSAEAGGRIGYAFQEASSRFEFGAMTKGIATPLGKGSAEEFIFEHYFGYTSQRNGDTIEYEVKHPPWLVWNTQSFKMSENLTRFYGKTFEETLQQKPHSVFVALGSDISVSFPQRIKKPSLT